MIQYDSRNRLTNQVWKSGVTPLASFGYTLGATGNRAALAETVNGTSRSYNWTYDYLYRLTGETIGNMGTVNYNFDAVGNRTNRTSSISGILGQTASFTPNDWLASDNYDNNGNTTNSASVAYQYDALNHLTNANNGAVLITYDGDGNRVKKTVGTTNTYYLLDDRNPSGYVQALEEWTASGGVTNLSRVYNYGLALISQRQMLSGTISYYGTDGHGSTRFLLNTSGGITDTYAYDAYGLLIASTGTTPNNYLYCCQQWASDLGMYYLRARYLNPNTGRFWSMDSYEGNNEGPLSLHKYLYCQVDPVMGTDPSGHDDIGDVLGSMDIGFSLAALTGPSISASKAVSIGSTCGPNITEAVMNTMNDVEQAFFRASPAQKTEAATYMFSNPRDFAIKGWDIEPLYDLGYNVPVDFGNGSSLGSGLGSDTVQFGSTPKVYYAGSVNYILWGRLCYLLHDYYRNPLSGMGDPAFSETAAVGWARAFKGLVHHDIFNSYASEAVAFTKFGYSATDPSSTALSIGSNPKNVGAPARYNWRWHGVRDTFQ